MRSHRLRALLALLVIGGAISPVGAEGPLTHPDLEKYLRWGPVRARPGFVISNLGYDDNVFNAADSQPQEGDFRVTLAPRLDALVLFGDRAFLTFVGSLDYTAYSEFHELNTLAPHLAARATTPFGRWGLFFDGEFHRTEDFPIDQQDIRNEVTERRFGGGTIFELGWRSHVEIGLYRADFTNRDRDAPPPPPGGFTVGDRLNRDERELRTTFQYRILGRTALTFETSSKDIVFDNPDVMRDADERRLIPGVKFGEGGRLTGSVRIGLAEIDAKQPGEPDFRGTVWDVELARRLGFGTTILIGANRDAKFSVFESQYYEESGYEIVATHFLNRILGLEGRGNRRTLTFSESLRRDRLTWFDAGVKLRLQETGAGRQVLYTVRIGRFYRDSNDPTLDQSRTTYSINAEIGY